MDLRFVALTVAMALITGCGDYQPRPIQNAPPAGADGSGVADGNAENSGPAGLGGGPPGSGPVERQRLDQVGVKRVELSNVVGVYLNAKASINSRLIAQNAYTVAQQFKAINGRYPNDYAELEPVLQQKGKALPELQPGNRYVFDPNDGQVYVESGQ